MQRSRQWTSHSSWYLNSDQRSLVPWWLSLQPIRVQQPIQLMLLQAYYQTFYQVDREKSIDLFYLPESVFVWFAVVSCLLTRAINSSFIASERTTLASERIWVSENGDDGSGSGWFNLPFFFFFSLPLVVFSKFLASFDTPWVFIWFRLIFNGWSHCWAGASSVLGSFTIQREQRAALDDLKRFWVQLLEYL